MSLQWWLEISHLLYECTSSIFRFKKRPGSIVGRPKDLLHNSSLLPRKLFFIIHATKSSILSSSLLINSTLLLLHQQLRSILLHFAGPRHCHDRNPNSFGCSPVSVAMQCTVECLMYPIGVPKLIKCLNSAISLAQSLQTDLSHKSPLPADLQMPTDMVSFGLADQTAAVYYSAQMIISWRRC